MINALACELIGSFFLVAVVIGSGIMGENLSNGNDGIALLANTVATGSILFVIIKAFSRISGAHFNPAVSLVFFFLKKLNRTELLFYILSQLLGGLIGVIVTHYIFNIEIIQISSNIRGEEKMLASEIIATFGLIMTILFLNESRPNDVALAVALFISAGYWFTASTAFANPAVTLARIFTDTFTGIHPSSVIYFISGQGVGSFLSLIFYKKTIRKPKKGIKIKPIKY